MLETRVIRGNSISDVWHQAVYACVDEGRDFVVDRGSNMGQMRKEFDFLMIHFTHPWTEPLLPKLAEGSPLPDPVDEDWFYGRLSKDQRSYPEYLMTPNIEDNETYTYGQRLTAERIDSERVRYPHLFDPEMHAIDKCFYDGMCTFMQAGTGHGFLNQIAWIIKCYKNFGYRNNQMVLQVARPDDLLLAHPPCLRHIDTRIQDGALHFFPVFRSWDLWGGLPANIAGIELLKQYMATMIGVENGEIIATCKGVHLYDDVWDVARQLRA